MSLPLRGCDIIRGIKRACLNLSHSSQNKTYIYWPLIIHLEVVDIACLIQDMYMIKFTRAIVVTFALCPLFLHWWSSPCLRCIHDLKTTPLSIRLRYIKIDAVKLKPLVTRSALSYFTSTMMTHPNNVDTVYIIRKICYKGFYAIKVNIILWCKWHCSWDSISVLCLPSGRAFVIILSLIQPKCWACILHFFRTTSIKQEYLPYNFQISSFGFDFQDHIIDQNLSLKPSFFLSFFSHPDFQD